MYFWALPTFVMTPNVQHCFCFQAVDEFFSKVGGQKLDMKALQQVFKKFKLLQLAIQWLFSMKYVTSHHNVF